MKRHEKLTRSMESSKKQFTAMGQATNLMRRATGATDNGSGEQAM